MDFIVLDTNIVSYLFKGDSRDDLYASHLEDRLGILSFMTIAELDQWVDVHRWSEHKRAELEAFLRPYTVIESDRELCRQWATIRTQVRRSSYQIETADAWVAATAMLYNIPLVSHNRAHFSRVPSLQLISEA